MRPDEQILILDATNYALEVLLGPREQLPDAAILGRENDRKWAGRVATQHIEGKRRAGEIQQVVVRFPDDAEVLHYDARRTGSYKHRRLCTRYGTEKGCQNPTEPWMFYCPPSKNQQREGPQICEECRRWDVTTRTREALANENRRRAAARRKDPAPV